MARNSTGFCAQKGCDKPRQQGSPYCPTHKTLNDSLSTKLVAVEFGYRACEAGKNLQAALEEAEQLLRGEQ